MTQRLVKNTLHTLAHFRLYRLKFTIFLFFFEFWFLIIFLLSQIFFVQNKTLNRNNLEVNINSISSLNR